MRVVDTAGMQRADAHAVKRIGDVNLMRQAGMGIADVLGAQGSYRKLVAFAGPGNNGGDAFAACAELARTMRCTVFANPQAQASAGRRDAEERARAVGVTIADLPADLEAAKQALSGADIALDGLLGVSARSDTSAFAHLTEALNGAGIPICALDLPTGIDATTGVVSLQGAVHATFTITVGAPKLGLLLESARAFVGSLWVVNIGVTDDDLNNTADPTQPTLHVVTPDEFLHALPTRAHQADKRSSGAPLIVAGSGQFPGAAVLCARGAARAGAGYVTVATPVAAAAALRTHLVEQVVVAIDELDLDRAIDELVDLTRHVQAIGLGPGLGLDPAAAAITRGLLERTNLPVVIDASGFAHIAKHFDLLKNRACVLTPHESEFARLSGKGTIEPGTRVARLREFVERTGITTLLKGNVTLIYDGKDLYVNTTGSNALATAGTGDVLTGIIATLLAQGLSPIDAARIGAYWHGRAGQLAAKQRHIGVLAGDLPELLAHAAYPHERQNSSSGTQLF